jgi:hypothetical protein
VVRVEALFAIAAAFFQRAAVLEIAGDPHRPEAVVAELRRDPGKPGGKELAGAG